MVREVHGVGDLKTATGATARAYLEDTDNGAWLILTGGFTTLLMSAEDCRTLGLQMLKTARRLEKKAETH